MIKEPVNGPVSKTQNATSGCSRLFSSSFIRPEENIEMQEKNISAFSVNPSQDCVEQQFDLG